MASEKMIDRRIREMPPLSQSVQALVSLMGVEDHSLDEVSRVVECDGQLTIRVLNAVNSSAFSLRAKIESLDHAVSYLGERTVMGIALATCTPQVYGATLEGYESDPGALWSGGLKTAIAAALLGPMAKTPVDRSLAYTAGIVHDVGKAILSEFLKGKAAEAVARIDAGDAEDYLAAERELVGIDHCTVGAQLADHWGLAAPLRSAIHHHHQPGKAPPEHSSLVHVVHLANVIAMMTGGTAAADDMAYRLDGGCAEWIDLSPSDVMEVMFATIDEFGAICDALQVEGV